MCRRTPRIGDPLNISSLLRILWRHKIVVGSVALVSLLGLLGIVVTSPPTYRAGAAVVLLNPPAVPTATAARPDIPAQYQNPYVRFGDLSVVVDILVRVTGSQEVVNSLKSKGLDGTFTIAANRDFYRGPIVDVAAESGSSAKAINDTKLVVQQIQDELVALQTQQGTDPSYFIRAELVVGADRATTVFSGTLRLLILAAGFGGMLTIGAGLLADAIARRRPRRPIDSLDDDAEPSVADEQVQGLERDQARRPDTTEVAAPERTQTPSTRISAAQSVPSEQGDTAGRQEATPSRTERVPSTLTETRPERHASSSEAPLDGDLSSKTNGSVAHTRQRKKNGRR